LALRAANRSISHARWCYQSQVSVVALLIKLHQGIQKGEYHYTVDLLFDWFGISCMTINNFCFYLQNRLIQNSQTGGQWFSDTSPPSPACLNEKRNFQLKNFKLFKFNLNFIYKCKQTVENVKTSTETTFISINCLIGIEIGIFVQAKMPVALAVVAVLPLVPWVHT
jgi:hypothetical protein